MLINSNSAPHLSSNSSDKSYISCLKNIAQIKTIGRKITAKNTQKYANITPKNSPFVVISLV